MHWTTASPLLPRGDSRGLGAQPRRQILTRHPRLFISTGTCTPWSEAGACPLNQLHAMSPHSIEQRALWVLTAIALLPPGMKCCAWSTWTWRTAEHARFFSGRRGRCTPASCWSSLVISCRSRSWCAPCPQALAWHAHGPQPRLQYLGSARAPKAHAVARTSGGDRHAHGGPSAANARVAVPRVRRERAHTRGNPENARSGDRLDYGGCGRENSVASRGSTAAASRPLTARARAHVRRRSRRRLRCCARCSRASAPRGRPSGWRV